MSAQWKAPRIEVRHLVPMRTSHLDAVLAIEHAAYLTPWTRGNFVDSLASGYPSLCLFDGQSKLLGYCVSLQAVDEVHLLNLTVAPASQGQGHARHMLDALVASARQRGMTRLWLEVREGNLRARNLYGRYGMVEVGRRKAYYPEAPGGVPTRREDAVLMSLLVNENDA